MSGAFRSGKTIAALVKLIVQHLPIAKNRILIGRLTYPELRDTVQKDFFDLLPEEWIQEWNKSEGYLLLKNKTEVLFRHLDAMTVFEMRGMTLGAALIDQIEEIDEEVYKTLASRINLPTVPMRQLIMTCNPALFWGYKYFKQNSDPDNELIEFSMIDNQEHLPADYMAEMFKRPESWKKQFVYGIWDESLLSDKSVIPIEYIQQQKKFITKEIRKLDDILIFEDASGCPYQIGVDVSEGLGQDYSVISGFNCTTGEQCCFWKGQIPPDLLADKILPVARYFNEALVIPEINGIGLATISRLKEKYDNIYHRQEFDKEDNIEKETLGWRTTYSTKPLLLDNFLKLLREGIIRIKAQEAISEMPTFVYNDDIRKRGMGAERGFYDDSLIATMLGCWDMLKNRISTSPLNVSFDNLIGAGRGGW